MTTNVNSLDQAIAAFENLPVDDRLAALGLIYTQVAGSLTSASVGGTLSELAGTFVAQIEQLSQQEQLLTLRDLLVGGGSSPMTLEYQTLNNTDRLSIWYELAQGLGSTVAPIPNDYTVSPQTADFLALLKQMDIEQLISLVSSVI